jgi:hypothetical protein
MTKWMLPVVTLLVATSLMLWSSHPVLAEYCLLDQGQPLSSVKLYDDLKKTYGENCADYFREHAKVRLGAEKRLPNGVSWRLQTDVSTGLALPRFTWMPDAQSLKVANHALDVVHGSYLLESASASEDIRQGNKRVQGLGFPPFPETHPLVQIDTNVTYATSKLISVIDLGYWKQEGSYIPKRIRGLTVDLRQDRLYEISSCLGGDTPYASGGIVGPEKYLFRFGDLLKVCDVQTLERFIELFRSKAEQQARRVLGSQEHAVRSCIGHYIGGQEDIDEGQEIVLYLTFAGLAAHRTSFWPDPNRTTCALDRSALNPVIIPYRELEPFMTPGPWRDELLGLQ